MNEPKSAFRAEFPLPDLTVVDWGYADYYGMPVERIRAIALLRALSNVP